MGRSHRAVHTSFTFQRLPLAVALLVVAGTTSAALAQPSGQGGGLMMPSAQPGYGSGAMAEANPAEMPTEAQPEKASSAKVTVSPDLNAVDLHVKDENIGNVLEMLSIQSRKNIIASKSVSGKVSADLYNVTFYEALDSILHVNGYAYMEQGNFIYVYTVEEIAKIEESLKRRAAKVMRLNYLNATDAAEFVKPMLSPKGEIKASTKSENFSISDSAPVGKDDYALGATLVVIDYEENLAAIEKLLGELDTRPAQVLVEATVLQTTLTEDNAFGFDFSIIGDLSFNEFAGALGGPFGIVNAIRNPPAATPGSLADNNALGITSTTGKTDGKSTFKLGVVTDNITIITRLLDEVSDTTVLANPKLLTLNRQPARVLVGQRVAYLNTTATETSSTQSVEFLDTGVQLYFRPFVSENREIRMELKPQVSDAKPRNVGTAGGQQVTVPDEITQEVVTNVIVPDGMTIVLGGLFRETTITSRQQVPFAGDLPIIGAAFRGQEDSIRREEIIFLVTPTIMSNEVLLSQGEKALDSTERVRAGTRQGLLPFSRDKMTASLNVEAEHAMRNGKWDEAAWRIKRSLALNPRQEDALIMREKLTGERELWPSGATFDGVINREMRARTDAIAPPAQPVKVNTPWRSFDIPKERLGPGGVSANTPWSKPLNAPATTANTAANTGTTPANSEGFQNAATANANANADANFSGSQASNTGVNASFNEGAEQPVQPSVTVSSTETQPFTYANPHASPEAAAAASSSESFQPGQPVAPTYTAPANPENSGAPGEVTSAEGESLSALPQGSGEVAPSSTPDSTTPNSTMPAATEPGLTQPTEVTDAPAVPSASTDNGWRTLPSSGESPSPSFSDYASMEPAQPTFVASSSDQPAPSEQPETMPSAQTPATGFATTTADSGNAEFAATSPTADGSWDRPESYAAPTLSAAQPDANAAAFNTQAFSMQPVHATPGAEAPTAVAVNDTFYKARGTHGGWINGGPTIGFFASAYPSFSWPIAGAAGSTLTNVGETGLGWGK